jgi:uncharacterized cupin superfamily protein
VVRLPPAWIPANDPWIRVDLGAARSSSTGKAGPPTRGSDDGEEEWLIVLDGRPTLRHPDGEDELQPWDVVFFPPGLGGAHGVRNGTDSTARVLMFSNTSEVAATVYRDSDKIAIWTGIDADDLIVRRTSGVDYWEGEGG